MLKADVAEWILSLTTTRERAASTVGDFIEEAARRGPVWFWTTLIGTTASLVWRTWAAAPLRMAGLAFGAWGLSFALTLISFAAIIVGSTVGDAWMKSYGLSVNVDRIASWAATWAVAPCQLLIGRWLARRAPGQELAACAAFLCADIVFLAAVSIALPWIQEQSFDLADSVLGPLVTVASLFAGVDQIRRQAARAEQMSR